jgi:hypothetical protein
MMLCFALAASTSSNAHAQARTIPVTIFIANASQAVAPESVAGLELTITPLEGGASVLVTTDTAGKATVPLQAGRYRVRSLRAVTIGGVEYSWDVESTVTTRYSSLAISLNPGNATRSLAEADTAGGPVVINPSRTRSTQPRAPATRTALQPGDPGYKDPGVALLVGFLLTGGGHMYAGETTTGVLYLLGTATLAGVAIGTCNSYDGCGRTITSAAIAGALSLAIFSVIDAPSAAKRTNRKGIQGLSLGPLELRATSAGLALSIPFR